MRPIVSRGFGGRVVSRLSELEEKQMGQSGFRVESEGEVRENRDDGKGFRRLRSCREERGR